MDARHRDYVGDKDITDVKRRDAYDYAEHLSKQGLANKTIKKRLEGITALLSHAYERDLVSKNEFDKLKLADYGRKQEHWAPFTDNMLLEMFSNEAVSVKAKVIWACLICTGMRLEEVTLLKQEQIYYVDGILVLDLNKADALKDEVTGRQQIPICDTLRPIIEHYVASAGDPIFPFPRNADKKSNSSNYMMRQMRLCFEQDVLKNGPYSNHSFRGTFKNKLRNARLSKELNDRITGHRSGDIAEQYGRGHNLQSMKKAVDSVEHP